MHKESMAFIAIEGIGYALAMSGRNRRNKWVTGYGVGCILGGLLYYLVWVVH
jgi:lipopolysaccharide export LptBFGC system permease protein LptF